MTDRLNVSGSATVDANGRAVVSLSPGRPYTSWLVERYAVLIPGEPGHPRAFVYRNTEGPGSLIEGTSKGDNDASDQPNRLPIRSAESLVFVWSGATPGLTATATVTGELAVER